MVVGQISETAEVLVIGGGPGGYTAALAAAERGLRVTLVERDAVGGVCLNRGCIPSKALIEVADQHHRAVAEAARVGLRQTSVVDWPAVQAHLRDVVDGLTRGVQGLLDRAGVTVIAGTARFATHDRVVVDRGEHVAHYEFGHVVLATGSRPIALPGLPFDGVHVLDAAGALFAPEPVSTLAVVGGGYIGVELGTALAKLGASVTIIEATDRLLGGLEPALGRVVARRLAELGVEVRLSTTAASFTAGVGLAVDGDASPLAVERVVVAVGRRPNTDDLGLEAAGVRLDGRGLVEVDGARRTTNRHVLAIGDLTAGPALAHKASAEAIVAADTMAGRPARFDPAAIPQVVFSDPEVVSVGLTVAEAETAGAVVRPARASFGASGRARTLVGASRASGHAEVVADEQGTVLGVHLVGPHVSELAGEAALAVELAVTTEELAATIHPHPTLSETLMEAAQAAVALAARRAGARQAAG